MSVSFHCWLAIIIIIPNCSTTLETCTKADFDWSVVWWNAEEVVLKIFTGRFPQAAPRNGHHGGKEDGEEGKKHRKHKKKSSRHESTFVSFIHQWEKERFYVSSWFLRRSSESWKSGTRLRRRTMGSAARRSTFDRRIRRRLRDNSKKVRRARMVWGTAQRYFLILFKYLTPNYCLFCI